MHRSSVHSHIFLIRQSAADSLNVQDVLEESLLQLHDFAPKPGKPCPSVPKCNLGPCTVLTESLPVCRLHIIALTALSSHINTISI